MQKKDTADVDVEKRSAESASKDEADDGADEASLAPEALAKKKAHFKDFVNHFSQWKNLKMLIGTSMTWFLLDIA